MRSARVGHSATSSSIPINTSKRGKTIIPYGERSHFAMLRQGDDVMLCRSHDVLIVGAGIVGTSIAYYLSRKGVDVAVLEKEYLGSGCSGANAAVIGSSTRSPVAHALFGERSNNLFAELAEELEADIHYRRCGRLTILKDASKLDHERLVIERNREAGIDICYVDRDDVKQLEPHLAIERICGAAYCPTDAQVDPFAAMRAIAGETRRRGGSFYFHTHVLGIHPRRSAVELSTTEGEFSGATVVIAAGIHSEKLTEPLGVDLPIRPVRGQALVTEPMPRLFKQVISPGICQSWRGNIILGVSTEEAGFANWNTLPVVRSIAEDNILKAPVLSKARIIRCFSGLRPMPLDGYPLLDRVTDQGDIYIAATHNGIAVSQAIGDTMARWIADGEKDPLLSSYGLSRQILDQDTTTS